MGILALTRVYGEARRRLPPWRLDPGATRRLDSILQNGLDRAFLDDRSDRDPIRHPNLRGRDYCH